MRRRADRSRNMHAINRIVVRICLPLVLSPIIFFALVGRATPAPIAFAHDNGARDESKTTSPKTRVNPIDGAEMLFVSAGEFLMGSDDGREDERPRRTVNVDGFWIYKHEVTVGQYRKFCAATGKNMPDAPPWGWQDKQPIVNVCWFDAEAYCKWAGSRLPTEAEWEKAARGTDGRKYPWGDKWDAHRACTARLTWGDHQGPAEVGSYPAGASPYGVLDMAGNVWEFCQDWYGEDYYKKSPARNPTGPTDGWHRVARGGSWMDDGPDCRTSTRLGYSNDDWTGFHGFRGAASHYPV